MNDSLNGQWISYREEGEIFRIGKYSNGLQDGEWRQYYRYPDLISSKEYYSQGKKVGIWEDYDEKCHLIFKVKHGENGKEEILVDNRMPIPPNPE